MIRVAFHSSGTFGGTANGDEIPHARKPIPPPEELAKLPKDGGPEYNRLVFEKSPYLLQHAGNPVDWYPWGDEAFEKARQENKPIFLSIGYTTCHWCHVMEHESFEDEEVARLMNQHFVCIKVDREERPDIDQVYMTVTQAMTGSGGWPMTVVMTPDRKPFFTGTYFPKEGRMGMRGMLQLLPALARAWSGEREKVLQAADHVASALSQWTRGAPGGGLHPATLDTAFRQLEARYDPERGGFSRAPKFPVPHNLSFLLRYGKRTGNPKALEMVEKTLAALRLGGVYDQIGFGTHRYSTDPVWLVPHFEKMLYDQALLAIANLEAWQATGKKFYARTAREIFDYVLREMTSPEGGFYSAEDADSEGEEGKYYLWTPQEVVQVLGEENGKLFNRVFHIVEGGNFKEEASGRKGARSIPHLVKPIPDIARDLQWAEDELQKRLEESRQKLLAAREKRVHPQKDDKVLTDWNGLMIAALALGGRTLEDAPYTAAAEKAANFVLSKLRRNDGRLLKRYRQNEAALPAHLEDYAFMVWGLFELYQSTFDVRYLREAISLNNLMLKHFWDPQDGGLFQTADDGEKLLVRSKDIYDGAIPSGNSVAALNLVRLGRLTANPDYEKNAEGIMKAFSDGVDRQASGHTQLLIALEFIEGRSYEIVIAGDPEREDTRAALRALWRPFLPGKVVLLRPDGDASAITDIAPYAKSQQSIQGAATAYVCQNFACKLPTTDIQEMLRFLGVGSEVSPQEK
ncbi:MAG: thioredoxin domain-containing protein [Planctomycetes bacterium]|nr:thioredoxin domain-containing protein [Planctomycetota bacterium]